MFAITTMLVLSLVTLASGATTMHCQLTHFPHFEDLILANFNKFVFHISKYPISYNNIRAISPIGHLWQLRTDVLIPGSNCVYIIDFLTNDAYPRWYFWPRDTISDVRLITVLQVHCPRNATWDRFRETFPIQGLTSLTVLRIDCQIREIGETFFTGLPNLFYLDIGSSALTSLHRNALNDVPNLAFLVVAASNLVFEFDLMCPVAKNLEYMAVQFGSSGNPFELTNCSETFDKVTYLHAHFDHIQTIKNNSFTIFPRLQYLKIVSSSLQQIQPYGFNDLKHIHALLIYHGDISTPNLPEIIHNLPTLHLLGLVGNNISNLNGQFGENLQYISLANNNIREIQNDTFINGVNLEALNLTNNNIKMIKSDAFQSLFSVSTLDISNNAISLLEAGCFKKLYLLFTLNISYNLVTHLTHDIFERDTTRSSDKLLPAGLTKDNKIVTNFTITALESLVNIDFSNNLITHIDHDTFNLPQLQVLLLNNNQLSHISRQHFRNLPKLRTLVLSNNLLQGIPGDTFHNLPLSYLGLQSNKLTTLPCNILGSPNQSPNYHLISLSFRNNKLTNNALCFLQHNSSQTHLPNLKILLFNNNSLTYINASDLENLPALEAFSFSHNPLLCSCDLVPFAAWVKSHSSLIYNGDPSGSCINSSGILQDLVTIPDDLDCVIRIHHTTTVQNNRVIISLCMCIITAGILAIVCGYFRMEIAAIMYAKTGLRLKRHNPVFRNKRYNVMIWCHDQDLGYASAIIRVLERCFTTYWNQRDSIPGEPIERSFERGIMTSERVIVILTRNFVVDYHCQLKFDSLHISIGKKDFSAVLIVADDDVIKHKHRLYDRIRAYVRTLQYLRHNDRLFWKKLVYKLPPPDENAEQLVYGDLVRPEIDFARQRPLQEMLDAQENNNVEMAEVNIDEVNPNNVYVDGYDRDRLCP